jgi:hypothetical protein
LVNDNSFIEVIFSTLSPIIGTIRVPAPCQYAHKVNFLSLNPLIIDILLFNLCVVEVQVVTINRLCKIELEIVIRYLFSVGQHGWGELASSTIRGIEWNPFLPLSSYIVSQQNIKQVECCHVNSMFKRKRKAKFFS